MPASPVERVLDPGRVKKLLEKLEQGRFLPPSWATVTYRGKELRINGQHSSAALCESGSNFPDGLLVHLDRYEVDQEDGMVDLFRQFDWRAGSRSSTDISGAYMKLWDDLKDLDPTLGLQCAKSISWFGRAVQGAPTPTGDDIGRIFEDEGTHPFILWASGIEWKKAKELRHVPVMAAMYGTYEASRKDAEEFWDAVIYRRHQFDEEHPATALENYLVGFMEKKEAPFMNGRRPKPAALYAVCVEAWNAWRAEKAIPFKTLLKIDPKKKGFSEIAA